MKSRWVIPILVTSLILAVYLGVINNITRANPGDVEVNRATGIDQPGCGNGINLPCFSIKYAVETVANVGERVLVSPGIYTETFNMQPGVDVVSQSGPLATIIDGEYTRGPMVSASGTTITPAVMLEGFTITGGHSTWLGGAVFMSSGASMVISNSTLISNTAVTDGGGISLLNGADLTLHGCTLEQHSEGALRMDNASATILHSVFKDNVRPNVGGWGGGIVGQNGCTLVISDTLFQDNHADKGGGLIVAGSDLILHNSTFYSNTAGGAPIHVRGTSTFDIFNNSIQHNEARGVGAIGLYEGAGQTGDHSIISNTIAFNRATIDRAGAIGVYGSTAVISGNHIISNTAENQAGGGLYLTGVDAIVTVINNQIMDNTANSGAGILAERGSFTITVNTIVENEASGGGAGVEVGDNAKAVISGNDIFSNTSPTASGGGISIKNAGNVHIYNNEIAYNVGTYATGIRFINTYGSLHNNYIHHNLEAEQAGGGRAIFLEGNGTVDVYKNWISDNERGGMTTNCQTVTLTNNIIAHNTGDSPQISIATGTNPKLVNNTIVGNETSNGIEIKHGSVPTLTNNIVVRNKIGIWGDGVSVPILANNITWDNSEANYGNVVAGVGDQACDPDLVDVSNGDYHLGTCSCAVDAGSIVGSPVDDYDNNSRPVDGDAYGGAQVDCGAYERLTVTAPLPVADFSYTTDMLNAVFTNTSSHALNYNWDFGDSVGLSAGIHPTYTYALSGTYTVQLEAICVFGCRDVYADDVTVTALLLYLPSVMRGNP